MSWLLHDELLLKLGIAALLGLVIGIERELKDKPLGLKTSSVIAIVSCLLTVVSIQSAYQFPGSDDVRIQMDPLRLAAQIVSGIGFLGAGVILKRGNDHISGLTTAAIIWGSAGIGIAVGAGFYIEAICAVALLIISVQIIPYLTSKIGPFSWIRKEHLIKITISKNADLDLVLKKMKSEKIKISQSRIKDMRKDSLHLLELRTMVSSKISVTELYYKISKMEDIVGIEIMD